ncbi:AMP-binding protein [Thermodesulfobacteriota bacterium]
MNIYTTLSKARRLFPEREAIVDKTLRLSYTQVGERIDRLTEGLISFGLATQDRISVIAPNGLSFYELYYAAAQANLVVNSINIRLRGNEIAYILNDAGSRVLISHIKYAGEVKKRR